MGLRLVPRLRCLLNSLAIFRPRCCINQQPEQLRGGRFREFCLRVIVFPIWHSGCTQSAPGEANVRKFRCSAAQSPWVSGQMSCRRILIVESDRRVSEMLAELLAGFPAELHFASSRSEAMEVSLCGRFPLCLISHGLSDGNGLPLFPDVFRVADRATGVLLSQHPDLWVIQQALEAGYAAVLGKPPDRQQLAGVLRRVFGNVTESWQPGCSTASEFSSVQFDLPGLAEIAGFSNADIRERLSKAELIGIIRAVEYPFAGKERLEYFDRDTLERVVCLVRRWSQQRLERLRSAREAEEDSESSVSMREELAWQGLAVAG